MLTEYMMYIVYIKQLAYSLNLHNYITWVTMVYIYIQQVYSTSFLNIWFFTFVYFFPSTT